MKKLLCALLALILILPSTLTSCTSKKALYSISDGDRLYEILGSNRKRTVRVIEKDSVLWESKVRIKKSVGDANGTYGLAVLDLNFDGLSDIKITLSKENEKNVEVCYLQNAETGLYEKSEALEDLFNIGTVEEQKLILSYAGVTTDADSGCTVETVVSYRWQGDGLIPYRRLTLTYYPAQNCYCYGVADYLEGSFRFDEPNEKWLTPQQFAETDWSFFYYFR